MSDRDRKPVAKPNFQHCTIFDDNLVAIHMKKIKLIFNKPVYQGMCILYLNKTVMYNFYYNYIKKKHESKATDSLCYQIVTQDFYEDISEDMEAKFDTFNFPKDHSFGIPIELNKKAIGMMKDECRGL